MMEVVLARFRPQPRNLEA